MTTPPHRTVGRHPCDAAEIGRIVGQDPLVVLKIVRSTKGS